MGEAQLAALLGRRGMSLWIQSHHQAHRAEPLTGRMTQPRLGQSLSKIIFKKSDVHIRGDSALVCLYLSLKSM
jgi:hypothetical protein